MSRTGERDAVTFDAARLAAVISPLRRALLNGTLDREGLPDIPDAQIEIIRALPRGTVTTPSELAARLSLGRSTVSNLLAAMEKRGLVARRSRDDDRRQVDVVATAVATGYFDRFDVASAALVADAADSLGPDDLAALNAAIPILEKLRDRIVQLNHNDVTSAEIEKERP